MSSNLVLHSKLQELWSKLTDQQQCARDELSRREQSQGTFHDVRKMNKLRIEIDRLEQQILRVESQLERV